MKKRILLLILIFIIFSVSVYALPSPTKEFYVNDFAGVIDESVEKHIVNISAQLKNQTGAQIVVCTVDSLDGMDEEEYALRLGREWGIGDKDKDNGFLILISTGDRALRFEVGYGLEGALPDGKCGRIQDEYMIPYLSSNDYSTAVLKGYDQIVAEVCGEYGIKIPKEVDAVPMEEEEDVAAIIVAAIFIAIIIFIISKTPPSSGGKRFIYMGGFGGSRGNFSGGFSGGGFSGGGGSFGGGGSSRRF